jgi:hypothetical protein
LQREIPIVLTILRIHALYIYASIYLHIRLWLVQPVIVGRCCRRGATERFDYVACHLLAAYSQILVDCNDIMVSFAQLCSVPHAR